MSAKGVLRGLHYQLLHPQAKLCRVVEGEAFDVAVDIRRGSPHFGKWTSVLLSAEWQNQIYIPAGFAHGYLALSEKVQFLYKCSDFYDRSDEHGILWSDPALNISWDIAGPSVSEKDFKLSKLADVPHELLASVLRADECQNSADRQERSGWCGTRDIPSSLRRSCRPRSSSIRPRQSCQIRHTIATFGRISSSMQPPTRLSIKLNPSGALARAINADAPGVIARGSQENRRRAGPLFDRLCFRWIENLPLRGGRSPNPEKCLWTGRSLAGEQAIRDAGVPHLIFRTAWVYATSRPKFSPDDPAPGLATRRIANCQRPVWSADLVPRNRVGHDIEYLERQFSRPRAAPWSSTEVSGTYHMTAAGVTTWFGFAQAILEEVSPELPWVKTATNGLSALFADG